MARTSEQLSPLYREMRLRCEDDECGHQFVIQVSVIRTVIPSRKPNPEIRLPFSNPNLTAGQRARVPGDHRFPANDDNREPANDDHGIFTAIGALMKT